jgi:hypothetical protein
MLGVFAIAAVYVLGLWWCYEVICRFRDDVQEIRQCDETVRRVVIVGIWAVTVLIAIPLVLYGYVVVVRLVSSAGALF